MCQARGWLVNSIFFIFKFKFKFNDLIKFLKNLMLMLYLNIFYFKTFIFIK